MRRHLLKLMLPGLLLSACADPEAKAAAQQREERRSMAVAETTARQAAVLPNTGLWSEAHVMERLLRAGVAPRANESVRIEAPWMGSKPMALLAGGGELYVWIYRDSVARRAVTDKLDSLSGVPSGITSPFAPPMLFITNNNIAAIVTGGRVTNHERIALALQAGLPAAP